MSDTIQSGVDTRYYPMLVIGSDEADVVSALTHIWEQYKVLPQERKTVLLSAELPERLKKLQAIFHLDNGTLANITICVRRLFFGELALPECEAKIGSMLATTNGGDPNQAKMIVEFIQKEILTIQPKQEEEEREDVVEPRVTINMPLLQALSKYENLGNQLITGERIRVKSQPEPVRPSLLYWLKYYRDDIGVGHHDSVQRGQFLFRSENGKRLSAEERERLGLILKSVEEDFPLAIDTERQEIIFPVFQGVMAEEEQPLRAVSTNTMSAHSPAFIDKRASDERAKKFIPASNPALQYSDASRSGSVAAPNAASGLRMGRGMHFGNLEQAKAPLNEPGAPARNDSRSDSGRVSFSAKHTFPAEKEMIRPVFEETVNTPQTPRPASAPRPNPFRIHPVSLGKKDIRNQE